MKLTLNNRSSSSRYVVELNCIHLSEAKALLSFICHFGQHPQSFWSYWLLVYKLLHSLVYSMNLARIGFKMISLYHLKPDLALQTPLAALITKRELC